MRLDAPSGTSPYDNSYTLPMPDPAITFAGTGYFTPPPRSSAAATVAFVCALLGVITYIPAAAAVVLGLIALRQIARDRLRGRGLAEAAVALGAIVLLLWSSLLVAVFWIS